MNPETGKFYKMLKPTEKAEMKAKKAAQIPQALKKKIEIHKRALREKWPLFTKGDIHTINGHDFKVVKINDGKGVISFQSVKYSRKEPTK